MVSILYLSVQDRFVILQPFPGATTADGGIRVRYDLATPGKAAVRLPKTTDPRPVHGQGPRVGVRQGSGAHGSVPARELISEGEVATALGMSRTPVREAFLRLEAEGLLRLYPQRGALVVPVSPAEAHAVIEARLLLEQFAATKVVGRGPAARRRGVRAADLGELKRNAMPPPPLTGGDSWMPTAPSTPSRCKSRETSFCPVSTRHCVTGRCG